MGVYFQGLRVGFKVPGQIKTGLIGSILLAKNIIFFGFLDVSTILLILSSAVFSSENITSIRESSLFSLLLSEYPSKTKVILFFVLPVSLLEVMYSERLDVRLLFSYVDV
jgi:hypothetical protein